MPTGEYRDEMHVEKTPYGPAFHKKTEYEYRKITFRYYGKEADPFSIKEISQDQLDELGDNGYKFVYMIHSPHNDIELTALFMKEIP